MTSRSIQGVRSPKLSTARGSDWYRYYAGYSRAFVDDVLAALELESGATVLDPWNGSGTTTAAAHERGYVPVGFDANPALVVIGRARLLGSEVAGSLEPLAAEILDHAYRLGYDRLLEDEPLEAWLKPQSAGHVRRLEAAIQHVLIEHDGYAQLSEDGALDRVSALAAFYYVALFEALRAELRFFVGSNPTWVRIPDDSDRISLRRDALRRRFLQSVNTLAEKLQRHPRATAAQPETMVRRGNSASLPLDTRSIDAAVTSPPYCTRIDYVIASRVELGVLGFGREDLARLRAEMVGTPTISRDTPDLQDGWGSVAHDLLRRVTTHSSRASASYYRKYFTQYIDALSRSLRELRRVIQPDGKAAIVVQDSYYKDVHIDLARMVREMAEASEWKRIDQIDFEIAKTKASMNPKARTWRTEFSSTESVVLLA